MKRTNRLPAFMKTVYFKMTVSYIVLIVISILMVGAGSYYYFSANFNEQIEKANVRLLTHLTASLHDNVVVPVDNLYLDIVTQQFQNRELQLFFDQDTSGNHSQVLAAYEQLKRFVAGRSELVESIDVYYKHSNIVLSSQQGILYLRERGEDAGVEWLRAARQASSQAVWLEPGWGLSAESPQPEIPVITYVRAYPIHAENKGYIAIKIKEAAVSRIIGHTMPADSAKLLLLGRGGGLMTGLLEPGASGAPPAELLQAIVDSPGVQRHLSERIDGRPYIVSYRRVESSGWTVVQLTPVSDYYERSIAIRSTLIVVCMAVTLFGVALSALFARSMYHPLRLLMAKLRTAFGYGGAGTAAAAPYNEYVFIHETIDHLSFKVDELASTLADNLPLIKRDFLRKLFQRQLGDGRQLAEYSRLLSVDLRGFRCCAAILELEARELGRYDLQRRQYIIYDLIRYVEQLGEREPGLLALAAQWDDDRIGLLLGVEAPPETAQAAESEETATTAAEPGWTALIAERLNDFVLHIRASYHLQATAFLGSFRRETLQLHRSYEEAATLAKYGYFIPNKRVLYGETLLAREQCEEELGEEALQRFGKLLKSGDRSELAAYIDELTAAMGEKHWRADHCHQRLRDLVAVYRQFLFDIRLSSRDIVPADLMQALPTRANVDEFGAWLKQVAAATFDYLERRSVNRSGELAAEIRQYIRTHLGAELSLDAVAEQFSLSPKYVSRLFKEETGENFTDFVTNARIERACELLLEEMNIEQIAREVGFNSAGYFIRKFKEAKGVTPGSFKQTRPPKA